MIPAELDTGWNQNQTGERAPRLELTRHRARARPRSPGVTIVFTSMSTSESAGVVGDTLEVFFPLLSQFGFHGQIGHGRLKARYRHEVAERTRRLKNGVWLAGRVLAPSSFRA